MPRFFKHPIRCVLLAPVWTLSLWMPLPQVGWASWYSQNDPGVGLITANGEYFDDSKQTCASWDYPFGTVLRVTNVLNGKEVICRVNDRGPARRLGRVIDLTFFTFEQIANPEKGLERVRVQPIESFV